MLLGLSGPLLADARIAIIIDDLGYHKSRDLEVLRLPGDITYAVLPKAPHSQSLVREAGRLEKEIILHLPMQTLHQPGLDKGGLRMGMKRQEFFRALFDSLDTLPTIVGINNHMGSLLTANHQAMSWLMQGIKAQGNLFFIDSLTSPKSLAGHLAKQAGIPTANRDVFLDNERSVAAINKQFDQLLSLAKSRGQAIAIGHPYPETIQVLRQRLASLPQSAVSLVKVSTLTRSSTEEHPWQSPASLSPSPKAAKNSKPSPSSTCCAERISRSSVPGSTRIR